MLSVVWFVTTTVQRAAYGRRGPVPLATGTLQQQQQQQQQQQHFQQGSSQEEQKQQQQQQERQRLQQEQQQKQQQEEELKRQQEQEAELKRQQEREAELKRQQEREAELKRQQEKEAEIKRQQEKEAEIKRQQEQEAELKRQQEKEAELKRQQEKEAELKRQQEQEAELKRQQEAEVQRQQEEELKRQQELQRQQEQAQQAADESSRSAAPASAIPVKAKPAPSSDSSVATSTKTFTLTSSISDIPRPVAKSTKIVTLTPSVSGGNMSEAWAQQQVDKFTFNFNQADKDKSGYLNFDEVFNILQSDGFKGSKEEAKFIFNHLDRNHDDKISRFEFVAAIKKLPRVSLKVFVLRKAFKALDKDNSGQLTRQEIMDATTADCELDISANKISELLLFLVKDDDDLVSFDEFLHVFGVQHLGDCMHSIFTKLDTDNSGYLSRDEILAATQKEHELSLSQDKISDLLKAWVLDADNKINYNEFVQVWKSQK